MSNYINSLERALEVLAQRINTGHAVDMGAYWKLLEELNSEECVDFNAKQRLRYEGARRRRALNVKRKGRA